MGSIVETAQQAGSFNTLLQAATVAGLADTLANGGPFTVFAPTDEAFEKLPDGTLQTLLEQPEQLATILKYHVVEGSHDAGVVTSQDKHMTLAGLSIHVNADNGVMINDANVIQADIATDNGIIHVIDKVLLPPTN